MTLNELKNEYPETYNSFSNWFASEGWGAASASDLSEIGFKTWFNSFLSDYGIDDILEYENSFQNEKQA